MGGRGGGAERRWRPVTSVSPLGRYADDAGHGAAGQHTEHAVEVRLLRLPVAVLVAARERHDSLLRECALLAAEGGCCPGIPVRFQELVMTLGVRYGAARPRPDAVIEEAQEHGRDCIDVTYRVPPEVVSAAAELERLMDEADELCVAGLLLTLPRSALELQFSRWYLTQIRRQVAGEPPQPWDGPLRPD